MKMNKLILPAICALFFSLSALSADQQKYYLSEELIESAAWCRQELAQWAKNYGINIEDSKSDIIISTDSISIYPNTGEHAYSDWFLEYPDIQPFTRDLGENTLDCKFEHHEQSHLYNNKIAESKDSSGRYVIEDLYSAENIGMLVPASGFQEIVDIYKCSCSAGVLLYVVLWEYLHPDKGPQEHNLEIVVE